MSNIVKFFVENSPKYAIRLYRFSAETVKPAATKFVQYARVEMRPPNKNEITLAVEEGKTLVAYLKSRAILQKKIKVRVFDFVLY
ncbi:ATP synthase subunit g, mitochondrial [Sparganum proliferum]